MWTKNEENSMARAAQEPDSSIAQNDFSTTMLTGFYCRIVFPKSVVPVALSLTAKSFKFLSRFRKFPLVS